MPPLPLVTARQPGPCLSSAPARRSPTVERAQFEHAIAILVGKAPADVTIGPGTADTTPPVIA